MTTIAFRSGIMCCDSCWTHAEAVDVLANKIYRLSSGALMGQAGQNDGRPLLALFDKVRTLKQLPSYEALCELRVSSICLLALPTGDLFKICTSMVPVEGWSEELETNNPDGVVGIWGLPGFGACGSGSHVALGAMSAGASARDAVAIACQYDINSRLPVHSVKLAQGRAGKRK